nr:transposase [Legionella drancourtii]
MLVETILPDLKKTKGGYWWLGRKLRVRIHLGVYLLQQLFNKTDRQIEYDVKDNAAYQLFCGVGIVEQWHVPDHTKIEEFRSRLLKEREEELVNRRAGIEPLIGHAKHGGQLGQSRMKSDKGIESSGYTAVLGFNMRQLIKWQKLPVRRKIA